MRFIALLVLLCGNVYGQQKPVVGSYRDFSGGLNNYSASVSLPANESPSLMNVVIDEPLGALAQRSGYQTCGTIPSGNTITNLYEYVKNDGSRSLIATDNTTVWTTADCVTYSTITTGLNSLDLPRFATVLDNLWIVNGSTWPIVWNGTTATSLDGADGRPTGPIAKYISYWKSRVWLGATPTTPSSVYFSALVDDLGNILDPATSTAAWTSTNQIYINRDDGSPVYGMKPYRDNLYVFKETGISRIVFESEYDLSIAKNVSTIGSKFNESIVEMDDGFLRFVGRDGIYAFDGSMVKRLSTKITPTFETLKQPTRGEETRIWDSAVDWANGAISSVSIKANPGSVALYNSTYTILLATFSSVSDAILGTKNCAWSVSAGNLNAGCDGGAGINCQIYIPYDRPDSGTWIIGTTPSDSNPLFTFISDVSDVTAADGYAIKFVGGPFGAIPYTLSIVRLDNGNQTVLVSSITSHAFATFVITRDDDSLISLFASTNTIKQNFYSTIKAVATYTDTTYSDNNYLIFSGVKPASDSMLRFLGLYGNDGYFSNGVFTSQISTFTGLTQWRAFGIDETLNGQTINYSVRTGTSAYNVGVAPWNSITSGAIISTGTDIYAQWKADFATSDTSVTPLLNTASMGFATGDTSLSVIRGINYKSRYWMSGSTSPTRSYNDLTIVESKSPLGSYTLYDLPLTAMTMWSGNLYGAIGNTGKIARLDYGSTDDGVAINSYWNSRDEVYENPIFYKTINQVILDYANSPANTSLSVGLSPDQGTTYQTRSVNLGASSLPRNTAKLNYTPDTALGFRTRVSNSVLGLGFKIYGIHNIGEQTGFYGN